LKDNDVVSHWVRRQ